MTVRHLGAGVTETDDDPWDDVGHHGQPDHPSRQGIPLCPRCGHNDDITANAGKAGGLICWTCNTSFTGAPGEWAANRSARELWAREYERSHEP
jgi:hypothetical protein